MANKALEPAVQARGYCCPYAFMQMADKRGYSHKQVAELLGVAKRTAQSWRKKAPQCTTGPNCLLERHTDKPTGQASHKSYKRLQAIPKFADWLAR